MRTRVLLTITALLAASLLAVAAPAGSAHAAAADRRQAVLTQAAVVAEVVHHGRAGGLPKRMSRATLADQFRYVLPKRFKIKKYKRLDAQTYRICIVHKKGGWATWHSGKGKLRASGRGAACRF